MKQRFQFHGGAASYLGVGIVSFLITVFTLGLALPWAIVMQQSWKINNTTLDGKKLHFKGTGLGLFGLWIKWWFFMLITLGIYSFWIMPELQKWIAKNTTIIE